MIDSLERSDAPSLNYKNAYQNVYKDQLEESLAEYQKKKLQSAHMGLPERETEDRKSMDSRWEPDSSRVTENATLNLSRLNKTGKSMLDYDY